MNERLDYIRGPDGNRHGLPVMGSFVVKDGKIVRWTDYWDSALIAKMMSGEDYSSLVPRYEVFPALPRGPGRMSLKCEVSHGPGGPGHLWVPRTSSTSRHQAIFMDESAEPIRPLES